MTSSEVRARHRSTPMAAPRAGSGASGVVGRALDDGVAGLVPFLCGGAVVPR